MGLKQKLLVFAGRRTLMLLGWRTIVAAFLKLILQVAVQQGWIPSVDESQFVAMLEQILDAAIWIFLALKGNRILGQVGEPVKGMGKGFRK